MNKYLEEFVARIDAPQLYQLTTMFHSDIDFETPELCQFISRTPTLEACDEARFIFLCDGAQIRLCQSHPEPSGHGMVRVEIFRRLSTLAQICTLWSCLHLTVENLYIDGVSSGLVTVNTEWLDLLVPFTAVENLYLSELYLIYIALALQECTGKTTEVLPALKNVFLEGFRPSYHHPPEGIAQFVSARQMINHSITISTWHRKSHRDWT